MPSADYDERPVRFTYHRFRSLKPNAWTAIALPRAPRGWRWLSVGEWARGGDLCCDSRCHPVVIVSGWHQTEKNHPVLTRRPEPK